MKSEYLGYKQVCKGLGVPLEPSPSEVRGMTKKIIEDKIDIEVKEDIYLENISLEHFQTRLKELIEKYGKDAYIDKEYYGYDGGYDIYLYFKREETDKEYQKRLKEEEKKAEKARKDKVAKEHKEKMEYERLKKKFEKENTK